MRTRQDCTTDKPFESLTRPFVVAILAASLGATIAAAAAPAKRPSAGNEALFNRLDGNDDGLVSADEVEPDDQRLFARLLRRADCDGDDALTRQEFLAASYRAIANPIRSLLAPPPPREPRTAPARLA